MPNLTFSKAGISEAERIVALVNSAYRGESSRLGWTTEADLLDGSRTDFEEILSLLASDHSMILLCKADGVLVGSVLLQRVEAWVELGMFAVCPLQQGSGIGKQLLLRAESLAVQAWQVRRLQMAVVSCREELIAFYERRGYRLTGQYKAFPVNAALWTPKVDNLQLAMLEKRLAAADLYPFNQ